MNKLKEKYCKESIIIGAISIALAIIIIIIGAVVPQNGNSSSSNGKNLLVAKAEVKEMYVGSNNTYNTYGTTMYSFTPSYSDTYNFTITPKGGYSYSSYSYSAYLLTENSKTDFENGDYRYLSKNSSTSTISSNVYLKSGETYYFYIYAENLSSGQYLTVNIVYA